MIHVCAGGVPAHSGNCTMCWRRAERAGACGGHAKKEADQGIKNTLTVLSTAGQKLSTTSPESEQGTPATPREAPPSPEDPNTSSTRTLLSGPAPHCQDPATWTPRGQRGPAGPDTGPSSRAAISATVPCRRHATRPIHSIQLKPQRSPNSGVKLHPVTALASSRKDTVDHRVDLPK